MSTEYDIGTEPDLALLGYPGEIEDEELVDSAPGADDGDDAAEDTEEADANQDQDEDQDDTKDDRPQQTKRDPVIPRARFDEVNAKLHYERQVREQLEAELADLRPARPQPTEAEVDLKALRQQLFELRLVPDGEAEADRIEEIIEAERDRRAEAKAIEAIDRREAARAAQAMQKELEDAQAQILAVYPWLDHNNGGDQRAISEVVALRNAYMTGGMRPAEALIEASNTIAKARGVAGQAQPSEQDQDHAPGNVTPIDKRKQAALAVAARVSSNQPPRVDAGVGNRAIPSGNSIVGNQDRWERASEAERLRYLK